MEYINYILVVVFFLAFQEYDFIIFQKRFSIMNLFLNPTSKMHTWYFRNNHKTKSWVKKNVLVFLLDGLHLNSSIWRTIAYFWFSQLIYQGWKVYALTVTLYVVTGTLHSIWNRTLFKFTNKKELK